MSLPTPGGRVASAVIWLALALFGASACTTLDEIDCASADGYLVGFDDGTAGYGANRVKSYQDACAAADAEADLEAWQAGYEDGLVHFCTPAAGITEGSKGRVRPDVCPADLEAGFQAGFRLGREIYDINQAMQDIEREIRAQQARLSGGVLADTLKNDARARLRNLESEYDRLARELRLLELRADRLSRQ